MTSRLDRMRPSFTLFGRMLVPCCRPQRIRHCAGDLLRLEAMETRVGSSISLGPFLWNIAELSGDPRGENAVTWMFLSPQNDSRSS